MNWRCRLGFHAGKIIATCDLPNEDAPGEPCSCAPLRQCVRCGLTWTWDEPFFARDAPSFDGAPEGSERT